jgi:hypothetical protein
MEAFSIAAALATPVQGCALIVLHLLPTGYDFRPPVPQRSNRLEPGDTPSS